MDGFNPKIITNLIQLKSLRQQLLPLDKDTTFCKTKNVNLSLFSDIKSS